MRVFHLQGIARGGRGREEEWGRNSYPFFPSAILAGYPYEFRFFDPPLPLWSAFDHARLFSRSLSSSTKTYVSEEIRRGGWNRIESILPASPKTTTTTTTKRTTKTHWNTYASLLFLLVSILLDVIIKAVFTRSSLVLSSFFYPFTSFYYLSLRFSLYLSVSCHLSSISSYLFIFFFPRFVVFHFFFPFDPSSSIFKSSLKTFLSLVRSIICICLPVVLSPRLVVIHTSAKREGVTRASQAMWSPSRALAATRPVCDNIYTGVACTRPSLRPCTRSRDSRSPPRFLEKLDWWVREWIEGKQIFFLENLSRLHDDPREWKLFIIILRLYYVLRILFSLLLTSFLFAARLKISLRMIDFVNVLLTFC